MLNQTTLARPYARAAFASAREHGSLDRWGANLQRAATVSVHDPVPDLLQDPRLTRDQLLSVFAAAGGEQFDTPFRNFLHIVARYHRLALLPEISAQFETLRREHQAQVFARVTSALPMSEDEVQALRQSLCRRLGRDVVLEVEVDAGLIGGAVISAQGRVIDGSVRGQLERLARQVAA